uniref:Lipocalin-like domain-containing protein n=1 Tax=Rhodopseudomonas palustris (strain BisA53) TaxID=316055 RepID=Q07IV1_RHOP5
MHRLALSIVLISMACAGQSMPAQAQVDFLLGEWQQIASNAGACPTCQISLAHGGDAIAVTANNGWSARVSEQRRVGVIAAAGNGRWRSAGRGLDGKPFSIDLEWRGDRLYMTMRIDLGPGVRTVKAVYGRLWLGS